jgi:glycine/D-amino acid oxidase-like deaminating enzyme
LAAASVTSLNGLHVDVAIVGAGINGASAAQHLSAAGYSVLVVDQGDFADGATSRSSRLLHCGLRDLATGSNIWTTLLQPHHDPSAGGKAAGRRCLQSTIAVGLATGSEFPVG